VVRADCCEIPFADAAFDLVVCSFALAHIRDLNGAAREVGRVAAAGADIFVSDLHALAYAKGWRTGFRDHQGAAEIAAWPQSAQELVAAWLSAGFQCVQSVEHRLGEAERPIFVRTGKAHLFDEVCHIPAILILHFQRPRGRQP
jgi:SAM-dependent methyltransferase